MTVSDLTLSNVISRFEKAKKTDSSINFGEVEVKRRDGTARTVILNSVPLDDKSIFGIAHDITEKKDAESQLQKDKEMLRLISENAFDFIWTIDLNFNITYASNSVFRLLGYTVEEILEINASDLYHEEEFSRIKMILNEELAKGAPHDGTVFTTKHLRKDGSELYVEISAKLIYAPNNTPLLIQGYTRDISNQIKSQEALRKSEEKYRLFLENNDAIILMLNPENQKIIFANNAALKFYGYPESEFIGMDIEKINVMNQEEIKNKMEKALEKNKNYFVFQHKTAKGELKYVEIYQSKFVQGNKAVFSIIINDVSDRILAEKDLRKFKLGIEQSSEAIFTADIDGKINYINPAFEKIYGFSSDEVIGKTPRILKSGLLSSNVYEEFWSNLLNKKTVVGEIINKTKMGKKINIDGSNSPILDEHNEIIGFLGIHKDITERKITEEALIESKKKAENADKMKSIFLAQMSHEIRTPINTLLSMNSLIKSDFEAVADEDQAKSFEIIERACDRIIRTVDLLINLSEVQAGTYETNFTKFDLYTEVLLGIISEQKLIAKRKNINLVINNMATNTNLVADIYTVNQIFL